MLPTTLTMRTNTKQENKMSKSHQFLHNSWPFTCAFLTIYWNNLNMWFTSSGFSPASISPSTRPVVAVSSVDPDWIIEQWTEDSWKDWLPERSGGPMLNTNLQKLWEKATNSSIFTVSSHRCVLREGERLCALVCEGTGDPNYNTVYSIRLWCWSGVSNGC